MIDEVSFYSVRHGDELFRILRAHYGDQRFLENQKNLLDVIRANNPEIPNPDLIYPGQIIALPRIFSELDSVPEMPREMAAEANEVSRTLKNIDKDALDLLSAFDKDKLIASAAKTIGDGYIEMVKHAGDKAVEEIKTIRASYLDMHSDRITRGQYDGRRKVAIKQYNRQVGPLRHLMSPGKKTGEVLRAKANSSTPLIRHSEMARNWSRAVKVAKTGVWVLRAADVATTAAEIKYAGSDEERTTILLDSVGSLAGGVAAVGAVVFLVGTPTGWIAMAGMALVGGVGSIGGETIARAIQKEALFDENGKREKTWLDKIW